MISNVVGPPEFWLYTANGLPVRGLNNHTHVKYTGTLNAIGELTMDLPEVSTPDTFDTDMYILISRVITDLRSGAKRNWIDMNTRWFIEFVECKGLGKGAYTTNIKAYPAITLLNRKISAYRLGAAQAHFIANNPADDVTKQFIYYNLGAGANQANGDGANGGVFDVVGRITPYFNIEPNLGLAPPIQQTVSWKPLLQIVQEISKASDKKGAPVFFNIVEDGTGNMEFKTWINCSGTDRSSATGMKLLPFSEESENIINPIWRRDRRKEYNVSYVLGKGEGSTQQVTSAADDYRIQLSPFNRREAVVSGKQHSTTGGGIIDEAASALIDGRTKDWIEAVIVDSIDTKYGDDWGLGDILPVSMFKKTFDARVEALSVELKNNKQTITAAFRNTDLSV